MNASITYQNGATPMTTKRVYTNSLIAVIRLVNQLKPQNQRLTQATVQVNNETVTVQL